MATALRRQACLQLQATRFPGRQRGSVPGEGFIAREEVPDDHCQLARGSNGRNLLTATIPDAQEEGSHGSGRLGGSPSSLDQHGACLGTSALADASMLCWLQAGLVDRRIQAEVTDQLRFDHPGQGHRGALRVGRPYTLSCELVLVVGRPCDPPGCAASANP